MSLSMRETRQLLVEILRVAQPEFERIQRSFSQLFQPFPMALPCEIEAASKDVHDLHNLAGFPRGDIDSLCNTCEQIFGGVSPACGPTAGQSRSSARPSSCLGGMQGLLIHLLRNVG
jgi:hypothetical protein